MPDGSRNEHVAKSMKHLSPDAVSRMRYDNLDSPIQSYVNNITEQLLTLVRKYDFKDAQEFIQHMTEEKVSHEDVKRFTLLMSRLSSAMKENKIPQEDKDAWEQHEQEKLEQIAVEILGRENVFGPQAIENTFGTKLESKDIPKIPFSKEELKRAKELNQFLVLRIDKAPDGQPLTMAKMNEIMTPKFEQKKMGNVFYRPDLYTDRSFYTQETTQVRWSLVSKEILTESLEKNYIDQTQAIVDYLTNEVFKDQPIPEPYLSAIQEFLSNKEDLTERIQTDLENVAKELESLKLTVLIRQTPVEASYDSIIRFYTTNVSHVPDHWIWTRRHYFNGSLVVVTNHPSYGFDMFQRAPMNTSEEMGVLFTR